MARIGFRWSQIAPASSQRMPCVTPAGLVVFVEMDPARAAQPDGCHAFPYAGRSIRTGRSLGPGMDCTVLPRLCPMAGFWFPGGPRMGQPRLGLYRLDPATGNREPVYDDPKIRRDAGQGRARSNPARRPIQRGLYRRSAREAVLHERLYQRIQGSHLAGCRVGQDSARHRGSAGASDWARGYAGNQSKGLATCGPARLDRDAPQAGWFLPGDRAGKHADPAPAS